MAKLEPVMPSKVHYKIHPLVSCICFPLPGELVGLYFFPQKNIFLQNINILTALLCQYEDLLMIQEFHAYFIFYLFIFIYIIYHIILYYIISYIVYLFISCNVRQAQTGIDKSITQVFIGYSPVKWQSFSSSISQ